MIFIDLSRNIAILLALCTGYTMIFKVWDRQSLSGRILVGVVFGAAAVIGMLTPMKFAPGVIFDGRSILISIAGLFGGGLPAVIAATIAALFRIAIGGAGVYVGCGVIVSSAALGVAYRHLRLQNVKEIKPFPLFIFGLVVHINMLLWTLLLPEGIRWQVFQTIALPVLLAYPIGTVIIGRLFADQDARFDSEKALRASEEKYRLLFDSAGDAIFIHDLEARMLAVNLRACELLGYTHAELMSMTINEIDSPEEARRAQDRIARLMEQGHLAFETTHQHKDGSLVPVEVNARKIIWQGQPTMMSICRDITDRKKAEAELVRTKEQLFQTQKMESIGNLAGGIAHDFNNIITVINMHAECAMMDLENGSELWNDLNEIHQAGERAANLTRHLLGFSRKQMIQPRSLNINQVISDMGKMLGRLISEDIRLETSLEVNLDNINADPGQLEQILLNLIVNARDAVKTLPETAAKIIKISTSQVFLDTDYAAVHQDCNPGWHMKLEVEDNGCGMSREVSKHIFEPFYTTKGVGEGTGMGLATVFGIVKQNHGSIYCYSEPGQGTTFKIYWPIEIAENNEMTACEPESARGGSEVILLAEDDPQIRNITSRHLRLEGYTVIEAENGEDAMAQAENYQGTIDLLFTDAVMPIIGGKELSEKIKTLYPDIPVLFASGYTDNGVHQEIINLGGDRFINKPYNIYDIMVRIRRLLDNPTP